MKPKIFFIIASIFLVLAISFFIFNIHNLTRTGFAIDSSENITEEMAMQAISESEQVIQEMQENNFSVNYMKDSLIEAKKTLEQAKVKWKGVTYADVLLYTNDIQNRKTTAFFLFDKINIEESKLIGASNETKAIFEQAKTAFSEERYSDTEKLLEDFNVAVEKEKSEASILAGIKRGAKNFFQRYWIYIIIFLIVISVAGYFTYKRFEKKLLINKIRKMKTEGKVLNDLMKKTQTERFKENKISEQVYDIRMKKYEERTQEIKQELPVLEERLKEFKNKKSLNKKISSIKNERKHKEK